MDLRDFSRFRALIHAETGIWLRDGKQLMLASRLSRRLRHHQLESFSDYYAYVERLKDGGVELGELINCVTTNKTSFFRESHHFDFLSQKVVGDAQKRAMGGALKSLRIWSAACSTGEEPYSIAISLFERFRTLPGSWEATILASDIDTVVLHAAQRGIYNEEALDPIKPELRSRYFLLGKGAMAGQVKVKPEVNRCIEFERINLMDAVWPVEGLFDVIFFRNALIYFKQETQNAFLRKMCRYLRPNGYLILGHSEHVPWLFDIVQPLAQTIYQLRDVALTSRPTC